MVRLIARLLAALSLTVHPGPTHHALAVDLHVAHARAIATAERYAGAVTSAQLGRSVKRGKRATSSRVAAPTSSRCAYAGLIASIWQRDAAWAIGIAWRESRCEPGAYNPSGASGLFQLLGHTNLFTGPCAGREFDAYCNTLAAWRLYGIAGRSPWAL